MKDEYKERGYMAFFILFLLCITTLSATVTADDLIVKVGVYENEPLIFTDTNGSVKGIYADIIEYIASKEGWKIEYIHGSWDECLRRLRNGEIDIMTDIAYSEERSKIYDFSNETVWVNWGVLYIQPSSKIESFFDLENKKISVVKNDIYYIGPEGIKNLMEKFDINCTFVEVYEYAEVLESVENKNVTGGVVNRLFGMRFEEDYHVDKSPIVFSPIELRFAFPKNASINPYLIEKIDYYMKELKKDKNSIYYQSIGNYLGQKIGGEPIELIPRWVKDVLLVSSGVIFFLTIVGVVSRIQVKRKTAELKESEEKYRTLVENAVEGIYRTTLDGKILEINPAVAEMFGYSREEFMEIENVESTYKNPEGRKKFIEKLKKDGEIKDYEIEYIRKDGKTLIAKESARLNDGIIEGIIHDVTEQKEYERKLEAIAEISNSLIGRINLDEIYGKSLREVIKALGADGGVIFELKGKHLYLKKTYGMSEDYKKKYKEIPFGSHLVGKVAEEGKAILIKESKKDKRATPDVIESEEYHSAIVVPIILEGEVVGSMGIISRKPNYFSPSDMETLQSVANQVAAAVNAVRMHNEIIKALKQEREFKLRAAHYFFNPIAIAKGYLDLAMEELPEKQKKKIESAHRAIVRVQKVVENVVRKGEIHE